MTAPRLSRDAIIDACLDLLAQRSGEPFTMRRLGAAMGVDATAVYRHFRDKDELLRAVGDRILGAVLVDLPPDGDPWREVVGEICRRVRRSHLARPDVAVLVRSGPPRQAHELALTNTLLHQLGRSGLPPEQVALAYHALIELTVGSAALDAEVAAMSAEERERTYRTWRATYAMADEQAFPDAVAAAPHLYAGTADDRFEYALGCLLDGITPSRS